MMPKPEIPTEQVDWTEAAKVGSELWIRRLDKIGGPAPGNKLFKLTYHLEKAARQANPTILTFGGAWSNHLHATAAIGKSQGIRTIGVVRSTQQELDSGLTPTLQDCVNYGMQLFPVSRQEYKEKNLPFFKAWLRDRFNNPWIVPEGAADALGVMGCKNIMIPSDTQASWDAVVLSGGTGATAAGVALALGGRCPLYVNNALKGAPLKNSILNLLEMSLYEKEWAQELTENIHVWDDGHFGGFGLIRKEVQQFVLDWELSAGVELDGVYTAKTIMRMAREFQLSSDLHDKKILFIHTGGLQGNRSWR
ncbi:MAG: pyridoxal-phosphate dependent enzyme [Bacteroidetes bacterium]|nr:pyridoxal-phosphate dependent enzyme [Bacteroidota bacterium]